MGKNIAKLVVKMKSKSLIDIETMGDGASQVFMAAAAVAKAPSFTKPRRLMFV